MPIAEKISLVLGGATLGAVSYAFFQKTTQPSKMAMMEPIHLVPTTPTTLGQLPLDPRDTAKFILPFGSPGPVNDIIYRTGYITSYNRRDRNPNWVAEHLTADSLKRMEGVDRGKSNFKEDEKIPPKFRARLSDYFRSGFDRGHMVPAADMKNNQTSMDETFYLTNISPQVGEGFNRDYWAHFESFCRSLVYKFTNVYVFTGPLYLPHQEADGKFYVKYQVIGNPPNVSVPTHFYKVIMTEKNGKFSVGAFVLPNQPIPDDTPLEAFKVPLDAVERGTGLLFFDRMGPAKANITDLCKETKCQVVLSKFHEAKKNATPQLSA
ncbi:hypothetical protein BJ944DRAFT_246160 [Cunninghamella echinulata]|nr:hypothetical protein BJ944DRAFT_246160 [Cunninghamella echinulata]